MYCRLCDIEYPKSLRFCKWCGGGLVAREAVTDQHCPACSATTDREWLFCNECGVDLASLGAQPREVSCPSCSAPVRKGWMFCRQCGEQIAAERADLKCEKCDAGARSSWTYCKQCGAALGGAAAKGREFRTVAGIPALPPEPSDAPFSGLDSGELPPLDDVIAHEQRPIAQSPPPGPQQGGTKPFASGRSTGQLDEGAIAREIQERPQGADAGRSIGRLEAAELLEAPDANETVETPKLASSSDTVVDVPAVSNETTQVWNAAEMQPQPHPSYQPQPYPPPPPPHGNPPTVALPPHGARQASPTEVVPRQPSYGNPQAGAPPAYAGSIDSAPTIANVPAIQTPISPPPQPYQPVAPVAPVHPGGARPAGPSGSSALKWIALAAGLFVLLAVVAIAAYVFWPTPTPETVETPAPAPTAPAPTPPPETPAAPAVPQGMVAVAGGSFMLGTDRSGEDEYSRPAHEVEVAPFFIDKTEVTNADYFAFVEATKHAPPSGGWVDGRPAPGTEKLPVVFVTWNDANDYAKWAGKRLPTEAEWELAARGTEGRLYSWGDKFDRSRGNVGASTDGGKIMPVGSFPTGASPYGALDMIGNVWEWTASDFAVYPGAPSSLDVDQYRRKKVIRGGAYDSTDANTAMYRGFFKPTEALPRVGFRCAKSAT
jgi:formylglycine-generating enzyme required for sulfatase activity